MMKTARRSAGQSRTKHRNRDGAAGPLTRMAHDQTPNWAPGGWQVTQPEPGWHQWETPAGRVYTQGPKRYPD